MHLYDIHINIYTHMYPRSVICVISIFSIHCALCPGGALQDMSCFSELSTRPPLPQKNKKKQWLDNDYRIVILNFLGGVGCFGVV